MEDRELLFIDLCARLPYGVKIEYVDNTIVGIIYKHVDVLDCYYLNKVNKKHYSIRPYLFPLSSMTEEQMKDFIKYAGYEARDEYYGGVEKTYYDLVGNENIMYPDSDGIDWLNAHHYDYRGLIPKGLAIDATGKRIY